AGAGAVASIIGPAQLDHADIGGNGGRQGCRTAVGQRGGRGKPVARAQCQYRTEFHAGLTTRWLTTGVDRFATILPEPEAFGLGITMDIAAPGDGLACTTASGSARCTDQDVGKVGGDRRTESGVWVQ